MDITSTLTIVGALGGLQGLIELFKWWRKRKVQDRHDEADVVAIENENDRKQIDWLEKRLAERDAKIDRLYEELRQEQKAKLDEIHLRHETELRLAEAEVKKCHKRGCSDRVPPSDY